MDICIYPLFTKVRHSQPKLLFVRFKISGSNRPRLTLLNNVDHGKNILRTNLAYRMHDPRSSQLQSGTDITNNY